jgi:chromosome segregation ATPase
MSASKPLLEAHPTDQEVVRLRREIAGLERELQEAKDEAAKAKTAAADAVQAIRALRQQLEPMYKALKMIFGEIARIETGEAQFPHASTGLGSLAPKWEMLKSKLGGRQAEFIDLLQHGEMNVRQIRAAAHCDIKTVYRTLQTMKEAGLLNKNGGKFSLKEL